MQQSLFKYATAFLDICMPPSLEEIGMQPFLVESSMQLSFYR